MRIYLAGPEVFMSEPKYRGNLKKQACEKYGHEGVFPLDNEMEWNASAPKWTMGMDIARENMDLIADCDAVIANLTPFRGPSADAGTVFEVGYARALELIVLGYTNEDSCYKDRVEPGRLVDSNGYLIEDFDLRDNLMIEGALSSPIVVSDSGGDLEPLEAFVSCLNLLNEGYVVV